MSNPIFEELPNGIIGVGCNFRELTHPYNIRVASYECLGSINHKENAMNISATTKVVLGYFILPTILFLCLVSFFGCSSPVAPAIEPEFLQGQLIPLGIDREWEYNAPSTSWVRYAPRRFNERVTATTDRDDRLRWWYHDGGIMYYSATSEGVKLAVGAAVSYPNMRLDELMTLPRKPYDGETYVIKQAYGDVVYRWELIGLDHAPAEATRAWKLSENEGSIWWEFAPDIGCFRYQTGALDTIRVLQGRK